MPPKAMAPYSNQQRDQITSYANQLSAVEDMRKIEQDTGWRPEKSLAEILEAIYAFWRENNRHIHGHQQAAVLEEEVA